MIEFLLTALLAGIGVALITGPLGCFVVWRRMAYFGDTLAHSALLGVALGLIFSLNQTVSIIVLCAAIALLLLFLQRYWALSTDTLLGILAHTSLALGVIAVSLMGNAGIDLYGYLFGDLLATTWTDVAFVFAVALFILGLLFIYWRQFLSVTVQPDIAQIEGIAASKIQLILTLQLALVIAVTMKVTGVLLLTALLIIPAAAARRLATSPVQMAVFATVSGILAVVGGLALSVLVDTPTGPSIVVTASGLFLLSLLKKEY